MPMVHIYHTVLFVHCYFNNGICAQLLHTCIIMIIIIVISKYFNLVLMLIAYLYYITLCTAIKSCRITLLFLYL